jgi:GNAT superfamily N-acetyltransferase
MNNQNINIKLNNNSNNTNIENFEKNEWIISDLEHYWKSDIDFTKRKYKFIAEDKSGEIVWILELSIEVNLAFIEALLVSSKSRKIGIGKLLIKKAEEHAKQNNCSKIYLETNEGWGAEEFYKKVWYKITWKHEKHILNQNTLIFTKFF